MRKSAGLCFYFKRNFEHLQQMRGKLQKRIKEYLIIYYNFYIGILLECLYEGTELGCRNVWVLKMHVYAGAQVFAFERLCWGHYRASSLIQSQAEGLSQAE